MMRNRVSRCWNGDFGSWWECGDGIWICWCWDGDVGSWWECGDGFRLKTIPQSWLHPHSGKCPHCALLWVWGSREGFPSPGTASPGVFPSLQLPGLDPSPGMQAGAGSQQVTTRIVPSLPCCPSSFPSSSGRARTLRCLGTVPVCFISLDDEVCHRCPPATPRAGLAPAPGPRQRG